MEPLATFIDGSKALQAVNTLSQLNSSRNNSTSPPVELTDSSCLVYSHQVTAYLEANQLGKWSSLGVVLMMALVIRFAYFCVLSFILSSRRR